MTKMSKLTLNDDTDPRFSHMRDPFGKWNEKSPYTELLDQLTLTEQEAQNYRDMVEFITKRRFFYE
uniref:Uncharacterized protein n=1 Tax=Dulem virus 31 TaxID=3145749 RepID=A0AAU8AUS9_9VIRU